MWWDIDLGNSYIILGIIILILFIVLMIFMPSTENSPRHKTMLKILLYFSLPSAVLLDIHNRKIKDKYIYDSEGKKADDVFNDIMYTAGNEDYSNSIFDDLYK
jgi:hypothetical protein